MTTILKNAIIRISKESGTREDTEIVRALVRKAKQGDTKAIEMTFDRIDGKVPQREEHTGADGGPIQVQSVILSIESAVTAKRVSPQVEAEKSV